MAGLSGQVGGVPYQVDYLLPSGEVVAFLLGENTLYDVDSRTATPDWETQLRKLCHVKAGFHVWNASADDWVRPAFVDWIMRRKGAS